MQKFFLSSFFVFWALATQAQEAWPHQEGNVDELDLSFPPIEESVSAGTVLWSETIDRDGAQFMQLELVDDGTSEEASAVIEILNFTGNVLQTISPADLATQGVVYTDMIPGQSVTIVVRGADDGLLGFKLASVNYDKSGARFESISEPDDREHIRSYSGTWEQLASVEGAVVKLSYLKENNGVRRRFVCTGFMVSPSTLVTNHHCVAEAEICNTTKVMFGYQKDSAFFTVPKDQYNCTEVLLADQELDVSLLRLDGEPGSKWGSVSFSETPPVPGQKLYVVQHPAGEPKQISDIGCSVEAIPVNGFEFDVDLAHKCDTLGGSSGSPVFDESGRVVALHHLGMNRTGEFSQLNRAVIGRLVSEFLGL